MADRSGESGNMRVPCGDEISCAGVAFDMRGKGIESIERSAACGGKGIEHGSGGAVRRWVVDDAFAAFGAAPELVDADDVFASASERQLEIAESLGGLEEDAFLLGQSMANVAIADFGFGREPTAEFFYVIAIDFFHAEGMSAWLGEMQMGKMGVKSERLKI
jgi:hypothetical protein